MGHHVQGILTLAYHSNGKMKTIKLETIRRGFEILKMKKIKKVEYS